ncbi:rhodanese-like domain-containing protein [Planctomicrobium piriforme]|uniref:Rhodanese-related sulfurtransferase n=1 Tax=Planctomicrobium piriforme TaxID=1576369 RepID=A0A1I3DAW4_9PLAN|nr:rhodanese-like domain-containing protein [Planctomicrobium piriforme]SFH83864.1 Rhodanese-related sulfurtransferase [Planctomicrobium piriforme]
MSGSQFPLEIDIAGVSKLLAHGEDFLFLDCREQSEYETARIDGTTLLPMSEIQERVDELHPAKDQRVVIHCHHGGRSLRVARWLRGQGFEKAQSMAGGIDAWSEQVDPSVPRY